MTEIKLGMKVKDKITGFTGIVVSYSKHMNGCDRAWIQPPVDKDGKNIDGAWFDVVTLEVINEKLCQKTPKETSYKPGGFPSKIK